MRSVSLIPFANYSPRVFALSPIFRWALRWNSVTLPAKTQMLSKLKPLVERFPSVANSYRLLRDVRSYQKAKPRFTRWGFQLLGNTAMELGEFEEEETVLIANLLKDMDTFVDVGANIGYYTCLARSMGKMTLAFEPLRQNLDYLYANLQVNGFTDVEVLPLGLGEKAKIAILYGGSTGASLVRGWAGSSALMKTVIPISTLDIILGQRFVGKRVMVKIDVEGAEYSLLHGAFQSVRQAPAPVWVIEIGLTEHHPDGLNPNFRSTFELFWDAGYESCTADQKSHSSLRIGCQSVGGTTIAGFWFSQLPFR